MKKWFNNLGLIDKILIIGIPVGFFALIVISRVLFWGVINKGSETPLPQIRALDEPYNLDTLSNKSYRKDDLDNNSQDSPEEENPMSTDVTSFQFNQLAEKKLKDEPVKSDGYTPTKPNRQDETVKETPKENSDVNYYTSVRNSAEKRKAMSVAPVRVYSEEKAIVSKRVEPRDEFSEVSDDEFGIIRSAKKTTKEENPENSTQEQSGEKPMAVIVNGDQRVKSGSTLAIKLLQGGKIRDINIPAGTIMYAKVAINGDRINAYVERVTIKDRIYSLAVTILDNDMNEGIIYQKDIVGQEVKNTGSGFVDRTVSGLTGGIIGGISGNARRISDESLVRIKGGRKLFIVKI